ncbi:hypothetical protein GIB67_023528 [Kingdonia uniflora]|uniref:Uncharacterized protein n=1 Tax=Kingdonia uniflora TaxID=39325 RepID=A0A7J7PA43_9MAGN|nr:hypothetical protein GIB67_023514 [Kingdonia uniflora]KAF6176237.1 hypothetical protein GIB67_023528 [Kingdonia uniflora]
MDIWSWMCNLPNSKNWPESDLPLVYELASLKDGRGNISKSIQVKAERTLGSNTETQLAFSVCLNGFVDSNPSKTLWVSHSCSLSNNNEKNAFFLCPLLVQLVQEIVTRAPTAHGNTYISPYNVLKIKPEPISHLLNEMNFYSPKSFSNFFNLVFLIRLFWLCVSDAPAEVGSLYFKTLIAPNLHTLLSCKQVVQIFLVSIGADVELGFMRTLGYMLAKWLILRDVSLGLQLLITPTPSYGFSYATEAHGLWILKGYAPILSMTRSCYNGQDERHTILEAKESVLRYALAHQQLEVVVQLAYTLGFYEGHIRVNVHVDNVRINVVKLGFNKNDIGEYVKERHFPSRIQLWVGPELGANYITSLRLGRSTDNPQREVETHKIVKGKFGKSKVPLVKATAKTSTRTKTRNWRFDQDSEGNTAIIDAILCDNTTGNEVATWKPSSNGDGGLKNALQKRYSGGGRAFNKSGSLVFAGDEFREGFGWRLSKEMEGSVLKWRLGGKIWLSYWPNDVKSPYFETRCVDWCEEVDLPLIRVN